MKWLSGLKQYLGVSRKIGIGLQILGAGLIASNLVNPALGFGVFLLSQAILIPICIVQKDWWLLILFVGFAIIDFIGIIRWLI